MNWAGPWASPRRGLSHLFPSLGLGVRKYAVLLHQTDAISIEKLRFAIPPQRQKLLRPRQQCPHRLPAAPIRRRHER